MVLVCGVTIGDILRSGIDNYYAAWQTATGLERAFLDLPSDAELIDQSVNPTGKLIIPASENVTLTADGDSMNFANGVLQKDAAGNPLPLQHGSWAEVLTLAENEGLQARQQTTRVPAGVWSYRLRAWPGSTTAGLAGNEPDAGGNVQLGDPELQNAIINGEGEQLISIFANGNNWQESGRYAEDLYHSSPAFLQLLQVIAKDPNGPGTKINVMNTLAADDALRKSLDQLLALYHADSDAYYNGYCKALGIVADLNRHRLEAGRSALKLIIMQPIRLGMRNVVPQATVKGAPGKYAATGPFDIASVPMAGMAVRGVVASIYTLSAEAVRQAAHTEPGFPKDVITISMFGLEGRALEADDGHLNPAGQVDIATRAAARIRFV